MEGVTELIPFLVKGGNPQMWNDFLQTCKELKVFSKKGNEFVPTINSLLNEPQSRIYGLRILDVFLTQSSQSVVNVHIVNWLHQCMKGLVQSETESTLALKVLSSLLEISIEFPDVRKQTSQVFVPKVLDMVITKLKENSQNVIPTLECLFACLSHYGKSCGSSNKLVLERILINLILTDKNAVVSMSKCFHLLSQTGAPGAEFLNYKQNWNTMHLMVANSLHVVLDQLFSDISEIQGSYNQGTVENNKLELPVVSDEYPFIKSYKLSTLFCGLSQVLETMLLEKFPTFKRIHPEVIFGVVCRTLAVTCKSLESKISNSTYSVISQICGIHISAIKLLNSLILCSRTLLLPFSELVSKLFTQIFKSTDVDNWVQGRERPFSKVREATYRCLLTWSSVCKSCSFAETHLNIIVESIIKDIRCEKKVVSLNLGNRTRNKGAKKTNVVESSEVAEMNSATCQMALACIPSILATPLSVVNVKILQEVVVKLLFDIQRVFRYNEVLPPPYSDSQCRVQLYSALLALCISTHPHFPPPLHYANVIFNEACLDTDFQVQKLCSDALNSIAHMLRPCAPSFDLIPEFNSDVTPISLSLGAGGDSNNSYVTIRQDTAVTNFKENPNYKKNVINGSRAFIGNENRAKSENVVSPNSKPVSVSNEPIDLDDSSNESVILMNSEDKGLSLKGNSNTNLAKSVPLVKPFLSTVRNASSEVVTVPDSNINSTEDKNMETSDDVVVISNEAKITKAGLKGNTLKPENSSIESPFTLIPVYANHLPSSNSSEKLTSRSQTMTLRSEKNCKPSESEDGNQSAEEGTVPSETPICRSKRKPNSNDERSSELENVLTNAEIEQPKTKKLRSNKNSPNGKQSDKKLLKDKQTTFQSDEDICIIDESDDEMMDSFVDSVQE